MGKKYIIELEDENYHQYSDSRPLDYLWRVKGFNTLVFDEVGIRKLTPYTEPDLEQVRKEAYEQGYYIGYTHYLNKSYKDGLKDAWEAARKIHRMPDGDILDLFTDCYASVCTAAQAILKYDVSEAIAKIKEYEDGKQEIKVGDEVERILDGEVDSKAVFLEEDEGYYHCLFWTGCCFTTLGYPKKQFRKTGRHFSEIAAVLEKMRGEQE